VQSGEEALALLGAEPFDVVLTDLHMPQMDGLALTRAIRERTGLNRSFPWWPSAAPTARRTWRPAARRGCGPASASPSIPAAVSGDRGSLRWDGPRPPIAPGSPDPEQRSVAAAGARGSFSSHSQTTSGVQPEAASASAVRASRARLRSILDVQ
jgi:hypothetical protein